MLRQPIHLKLTFVLVLYIRLLFEAGASADICSKCTCDFITVDCKQKRLNSLPNATIMKIFKHLELGENNIANIDIGILQTFNHLKEVNLSYNRIQIIKKGSFQGLTVLEELNLGHNEINTIEEGSFENLFRLKKLYLNGNALQYISSRIFPYLLSLTFINLGRNQIQKIEDGTFLFLPKITKIDFTRNIEMDCGCHLPALVNYTKKAFNRPLVVSGLCRESGGNIREGIGIWNISKYPKCQNYSLFQRGLQCQSCEGTICNDSDVTICSGNESVCMTNVSTGVARKVVRSCRAYKECMGTMANKFKTCRVWDENINCASCCSGNLCNKHHFVGSHFVIHFAYTRSTTSNPTARQIAQVMENGLSKQLNGIFSVEYCGLVNDSEIFTIRCTVPISFTKDEVETRVYYTLHNLQELKDKVVSKNMERSIRENFCEEDTTSYNGKTFKWPRTKVGTTATLKCRVDNATRNCSPRKCPLHSGVWQKPDMSQCNNIQRIFRKLENLKNQNINERNIEKVAKEFVNVSQTSEYFQKETIGLSISILEKLLPLVSRVPADITLNQISASINNLMNAPEGVWVEAEEADGSTSRILKIVEAIPKMIPLKEQHVTVSYPNFGFGVSKVDKDTFNGLSFRILYGNKEAKTTVHNSYQGHHEQDIKKFNYISLPKSILNQLSHEERLNVSRITSSSMRDDMLYRAILNSSSKPKTKINSRIIAATIPNIAVTNLDEPVTISFILLDQNTYKARCVYWDETPGGNPQWSTTGCNISYDDPGKRVLCSCNHLTNFALLMDVFQKEGNIKNTQSLSIISNIGCGISLVCLILTIIIHVFLKNLWKSLASKILVSLCSSLAITNLIFVAGMQVHAVQSIAVCKTVAALLHYFLLASFMWMTIEAINVFLSVVITFKTYQISFMMRTSILAWGLPAIIVILTLSINFTNNYTRIAEVCWLSNTPFYVAFLTPVVIILALNLGIFVYVIWRVATMQNFSTVVHKTRKIRFWGVVGLFILLGFTWIIAFFSFGEAAEEFQYLFAIFNTLQGTFIFIFYCIYKKDTRDIIHQFIRDQKEKHDKKREDKYDKMKTEGETAETQIQN